MLEDFLFFPLMTKFGILKQTLCVLVVLLLGAGGFGTNHCPWPQAGCVEGRWWMGPVCMQRCLETCLLSFEKMKAMRGIGHMPN